MREAEEEFSIVGNEEGRECERVLVPSSVLLVINEEEEEGSECARVAVRYAAVTAP